MSAGAVGTNPIQAAIQALRWSIPFKKGGNTTSGMDAAGLVQWVFAQAGVQLPARANQQYSYGNNVPVGPPGNNLAYVQPGDVIFQGTSNPGTEQEGIVYSTAGQGTIITSIPGKGVIYTPIVGAIDQIRRYQGSVEGNPGDPYSSTVPKYQSVNTDYIPSAATAISSSFVMPNINVNPSRTRDFLVLVGVVGLVVMVKHKKNG